MSLRPSLAAACWRWNLSLYYLRSVCVCSWFTSSVVWVGLGLFPLGESLHFSLCLLLPSSAQPKCCCVRGGLCTQGPGVPARTLPAF